MTKTYQSADDCPLGDAHGMASTHHNADDVMCCDFCGFPVADDCEACNGAGRVIEDRGLGTYADLECTDCGGTGITFQTERKCACQK